LGLHCIEEFLTSVDVPVLNNKSVIIMAGKVIVEVAWFSNS
jgi:hypothetical protein